MTLLGSYENSSSRSEKRSVERTAPSLGGHLNLMKTLEMLSFAYCLAVLGAVVYAFNLLSRIARAQERTAAAVEQLARKNHPGERA